MYVLGVCVCVCMCVYMCVLGVVCVWDVVCVSMVCVCSKLACVLSWFGESLVLFKSYSIKYKNGMFILNFVRIRILNKERLRTLPRHSIDFDDVIADTGKSILGPQIYQDLWEYETIRHHDSEIGKNAAAEVKRIKEE